MRFIKRLFLKKLTLTEAMQFAYWCMHSGRCTQSVDKDDYLRFCEDRDKWIKLWSR